MPFFCKKHLHKLSHGCMHTHTKWWVAGDKNNIFTRKVWREHLYVVSSYYNARASGMRKMRDKNCLIYTGQLLLIEAQGCGMPAVLLVYRRGDVFIDCTLIARYWHLHRLGMLRVAFFITLINTFLEGNYRCGLLYTLLASFSGNIGNGVLINSTSFLAFEHTQS